MNGVSRAGAIAFIISILLGLIMYFTPILAVIYELGGLTALLIILLVDLVLFVGSIVLFVFGGVGEWILDQLR